MSETVYAGWRQRPDVLAATAGLLLGIAIFAFSLTYSNVYVATIGPLLIIVCLLYLVLRRKLVTDAPHPAADRRTFLTAGIVFWFSLAASIFTLGAEPLHRPVAYFILTAAAAAAIAVQIFNCRQKSETALILLEIIIVSLSVSASAYWIFPSIPGSDPWAHKLYTEAFVAHAGIPGSNSLPFGISDAYLYFPIAHLDTGSMMMVTMSDYKTAAFLAISMPTMLSAVFIFLIGRNLVNTTVGLLAALMFSLSDFVLSRIIEPIPTSIGVVLFTIIIYLLILNAKRVRTAYMALVTMLLMVLIMTHTLSTFVMLVFIAAALIGAYAYRFLNSGTAVPGRNIVTPTLLALFTVMTLGYWRYAASISGVPFFNMMMNGLFDQLTARASLGGYSVQLSQQQFSYLNIAGFLVMVFFAVLGCLLWLSRAHFNKTRSSLITALVVLTGITFGFAAFGIKIIIPERWISFCYVLLALLAAAGMFGSISRLGSAGLRNALLAGIVFASSFLMISNRVANMDSPFYAPEINQRRVYTDAEMAISERLAEVYDGTIISDRQYGSCVIKKILGRSVYYLAYPVDEEQLEEQLNRGVFLWRNVMAKRPVQTPNYLAVLGNDFSEKLDSSRQIIYTNNDGSAYLSR